MYPEKKEDLSLYYWLVDSFENYPFIKISDSFPNEDLKVSDLPLISIDVGDIDSIPFEFGNPVRKKFRTYYVDIFAKNLTQRDEFGYKIYNELDYGIPIYDYDEGFPPDVSPTQLNKFDVEEKKLVPIKIMAELTDQMYYRSSIRFICSLKNEY
jgi:hypothetical protein